MKPRANGTYSRFQVTFHCNMRSSKVHSRIRKSVCKISIWLASLSSGANHSLYLQTDLWNGLWILNFGTTFRTSQRSSEYYSEKLPEIDCKASTQTYTDLSQRVDTIKREMFSQKSVRPKSRYYKEGNVQSKKRQAIRQHSSWAPCS